MAQTKRMLDEMQEVNRIDDYEYQYEQWLEQQKAELAAYEEMLSDAASFIVIK